MCVCFSFFSYVLPLYFGHFFELLEKTSHYGHVYHYSLLLLFLLEPVPA